MSVVRKPVNPNPVLSQPVPPTQYQNTVPVQNVNIDLSNVRWVRMGTGVRKINPGELVIFKPLSEVREIRNGTAWVVTAYVIEWRDQNGQLILSNTIAEIYMQTVLARKVKDAMAQYGSDNIYIKAQNKGKQPGRRYFDFDVEVGVPGNA
jgi:hypothetical protein